MNEIQTKVTMSCNKVGFCLKSSGSSLRHASSNVRAMLVGTPYLHANENAKLRNECCKPCLFSAKMHVVDAVRNESSVCQQNVPKSMPIYSQGYDMPVRNMKLSIS